MKFFHGISARSLEKAPISLLHEDRGHRSTDQYIEEQDEGLRPFLCEGRQILITRKLSTLHPEVSVWETVTPYYEKRNIHFYVNRCGFHIFNSHRPDLNDPETSEEPEEQFPDGMFRFEKGMISLLFLSIQGYITEHIF